MHEYNNLQENFPFLTCLKYGDHEYICIIQNSDDRIVTFYNFEKLRTEEEKQNFLELGDIWWWESNRLIPINIFFNGEMKQYRHTLTTINTKDIEVVFGPIISLNNLIKKRIKRRQIQLVKKS